MAPSKSLIFLIIASAISNIASMSIDNDAPVVHLRQGKAIGKIMESSKGKPFRAFLGIQYGKIPQRFQRAEPADEWTEPLMATTDGPVCQQLSMGSNTPHGEEDCLYLNVYAPEETTPEEKYPVLFYIHGGAFMMGEGSSTSYKPHLLMSKDIVLIVINYRLGPLGFLSTGDEEAPGNYGLMDQTLALEWARDNAEFFGGDPNMVTIFGESAGGASIIFHLLSPLSSGLFHAAISQSGSAVCPWAINKDPLATTKKIARNIGCPTENTKEVIECLRKSDAYSITLAASNGTSNIISEMMTTVPVVENSINGQFLTELPLKLLQEGRFNKVPVISGVTTDEAFMFLKMMQMRPEISGLTEHYDDEQWATAIRILSYDSKLSFEDAMLFKEEYFEGVDWSDKNDITIRKLELVNDAVFKSGNDETVRLLAAAGVPTYMYVMDHTPSSPLLPKYGEKPAAIHAVDLCFLFNITGFFPVTFKDEDYKVSDDMVNMWTNFAKYGNPTPDGDPTEWPPNTPGAEKVRYLNIDPEMLVIEGYLTERMKMFHDLYYS